MRPDPDPATGSISDRPWAPRWAVEIASECPKKLGRAKSSLRERKAILTELALEACDLKLQTFARVA